MTLVTGLGISAVRAYHTTDFFCFDTAARLVATGADPYDTTTWATATAGSFPDYRGVIRSTSCPGRFGFPLWTAIALLPLTLLSPAAAAGVWEMLLIASAAIGVVGLALSLGRRDLAIGLALVVAASQPFWLTVLTAQFGGLLLGAIGLSSFLVGARRDAAGAGALAIGFLKPHVAALIFVAMVVRAIGQRRLRFLFVLGGAFAGLVLAAFAVRPGWLAEYAVELATNRAATIPIATSLLGLAFQATGSVVIAVAVTLAAVGAGVMLLRRRALADVDVVATGAAASLVLSPYLGSHDQLLLAPAWAVMLARGGLRGTIATGLLAVPLPWVLYALKGTVGGPRGSRRTDAGDCLLRADADAARRADPAGLVGRRLDRGSRAPPGRAAPCEQPNGVDRPGEQRGPCGERVARLGHEDNEDEPRA